MKQSSSLLLAVVLLLTNIGLAQNVLGTLAQRLNTKLKFDRESKLITNSSLENDLLKDLLHEKTGKNFTIYSWLRLSE